MNYELVLMNWCLFTLKIDHKLIISVYFDQSYIRYSPEIHSELENNLKWVETP